MAELLRLAISFTIAVSSEIVEYPPVKELKLAKEFP